MVPEKGGTIDTMASRAVILARVSTKEQELEGYSLDAQERLLVEYSKQHALRVMRTFRISETASKKDERRTFDEMMRYVARNHIPHLVCEKVDRLLRNFKDTVMIEAWLEEDTARRLHLVKNSIVLHKNSPSQDKFMWGIHVVVAKNYIDNLREEVAKGWEEKLRAGWLPGVPPLGYDNVGEVRKRIQRPNPEAAPLIQTMFELAKNRRYSVVTLTREMTGRGLRTRNGRPLSPSHVHKLLRNPYYVGVIPWNGRTYPGSHTPIISPELFAEVQQALSRPHVAQYQKHTPLFQGLITCRQCTSMVTWEVQKDHWYGRCRGPRRCLKRKYARADEVEAQLMPYLRALQAPVPRLVTWLRATLKEAAERDLMAQSSGIRSLEERDKALAARARQLYLDKLDGRVPVALYDELSAELQMERQGIARALARLQNNDYSHLDRGLAFVELTQTAGEQFEDSDVIEEKRDLITRLFSSLTLDGQRLICEYNKYARCILDKVRRTKPPEGDNFEPAISGFTNGKGAFSWAPHPIWLELVDEFRELFGDEVQA